MGTWSRSMPASKSHWRCSTGILNVRGEERTTSTRELLSDTEIGPLWTPATCRTSGLSPALSPVSIITSSRFSCRRVMLRDTGSDAMTCQIIGGGRGILGCCSFMFAIVRDTAWSFRSLAYGAFVSPDGTPEQAYFTDKLRNNIALQEGEHGLTLNITDTPDRTIAYNYGKTTAGSSQASNPSPLGAWGIDPASEIYAQHGNQNNVNPNTLSKAGSMFQEAFLTCSLGLVRQLGVADTKPLLQFLAKRYLHTLLDPNVNDYLIEQYVCPAQLKSRMPVSS